MTRLVLSPLVIAALVAPTCVRADVPVMDKSILEQDLARGETTRDIEAADRDRHTVNTSVTCSMYRPSRRNDPVGAAERNSAISGLVRRVAREERVNENEFLSLVYQESRFNPCAKSSAGATGLAQLMPGTAAALGVNENNIEENLRGGARYYKQQLQHYRGNVTLALAAYNSGPANVDKYGGIPPFKETQAYVRNITQDWLPAFGGSDKSDIPLNYGAGTAGYSGMRDTTLRAMGATTAINDSLANVSSWYQQLANIPTGTVQDSWDHNSAARNAKLEMINNVITLGTAMADLVNSRNALAASNLSSSQRSTQADGGQDKPLYPSQSCGSKPGLVWNPVENACVQVREDSSSVQLMLRPQ